jgi:hypothetical protein
MDYFINYSTATGITINNYRMKYGTPHNDLCELINDSIIIDESGSCPLKGAKTVLASGRIFSHSEATPEMVLNIFKTIVDFEDSSRR